MLHAGAAPGTGTAIGAAGLADRYDQLVARLLAAATDGGADATVFVVCGVAIALLGAGEAGHRTGFDDRPDEAEIGRGLPRDDPASYLACVGAVEVEPDAAAELREVALAETRICAGGTAGGAIETLLDAAQEHVAIQVARMWMQVDDLLNGHGLLTLRGHRCSRHFLDGTGPGEVGVDELD